MKGFALALMAVALAYAGEVAKAPEIPVDVQSKYQKLVIQRKNVQLDENQLQLRYLNDEQNLARINKEIEDVRAEAVKTMKLDEAKYSLAALDDSLAVVEKK